MLPAQITSYPGTAAVKLYQTSPVGVACTSAGLMALYNSRLYNCQSGFYAAYTTNVAGGLLGSIPYQSAAATTAVIGGNTAATDQVLVSHGTGTISAIPTFSNAPALSATNMTSFPAITALTYGAAATSANCNSSASPAVCAAAPAGTVTIAAGATTKVVNTTAVTANSEILVLFDSSLGSRLGVTCNATVAVPTVSARTAATSFTISTASAPSVNPACYSYSIVN